MKRIKALLLAGFLTVLTPAGVLAEKIEPTVGQDGLLYWGSRVLGLADHDTEYETVYIPAENDGKPITTVGAGFDDEGWFRKAKVKNVVLPTSVDMINREVFAGNKYLESINLENVTDIDVRAFERCESLKDIGENTVLPADMKPYAFSRSGLETVRIDGYIPKRSMRDGRAGWFEDCKSLRTAYVGDEAELIQSSCFSGCESLDYVYFGENVKKVDGLSFAHCKNLRTLVVPNKEFRPYSVYENPNYMHGNPAFEKTYGFTIICHAETLKKRESDIQSGKTIYAWDADCYFLPSLIDRGEPSTVVAKAEQNATVTVNGTKLPAYTLNGSVYVSENALKTVGFTTYWDGEARTTTVTAPENIQWSVELNTNTEPKTVDVVSSDIVFWYKGFRLPSLNIGNGESLVDVNALAEEVLYTIQKTDSPKKSPIKVDVNIVSEPTEVYGEMVDSEYRQYPLLEFNYHVYIPLTYWDSAYFGIKAQWPMSDHISIETTGRTGKYHDYLCDEKNPETDVAEKFSGTVSYNGKEKDNTELVGWPLLIYRDILYIPYDSAYRNDV